MIFVQICVGSSCHLKGSAKLVELFQNKLKETSLSEDIILSGSFCLGKCNRYGVTVSVGDGEKDTIHTGVTPEGFDKFWEETIIPALKESEGK